MEGNVIALGICIIFIDQASSMLLFFLRGSGSAGGRFRLTSQPLHTQAGPQSLTQLKNGAGSPSVTKQEAASISVRLEVEVAGFDSQLCHHLAV